MLKQENLALAMLRFAPGATIHEHAAPFPIDVICLQGRGMTSVDGEAATIRAGQRVHWPAHRQHRLWTEEAEMVTLMIEHIAEEQGGN